jgi:DNA-binding MarR family transcriptional regulator
VIGGGSHPRYELDEMIHAPVRLSVVAALAAVDRIDFRLLRDAVEVSDSLLSKHLTTLENAGYVEITKGRLGRRAQTWIQLTAAGTAAFDDYQRVLRRILHGDAGVHPPNGSSAESP